MHYQSVLIIELSPTVSTNKSRITFSYEYMQLFDETIKIFIR